MGLLDTAYDELRKPRAMGLRVGDFVPYVSGLLAADDARLAAQQGNYGEAAGALAGLIPGGAVVKKLTGVDLGSVSPRQIFAGKKAKGADLEAMKRAEARLSAGDDPRKVWSDEGWFRGADGKMRWEIDDSSMKLNTADDIKRMRDQALVSAAADRQASKDLLRQAKVQPDLFPKSITQSRGDLRKRAEDTELEINRNYGLGYAPSRGNFARIATSHDELFGAYPGMKQGIVVEQRPMGQSIEGFQSDGRIGLNTDKKGLKSTLLHELQHGVQDREGFAAGGSPDIARGYPETYGPLYEEVAKAGGIPMNPTNDRQIRDVASLEWYKRLGGEVEARAAENRRNLNAQQRRERFPVDDYDRPLDKIINIFGPLYED